VHDVMNGEAGDDGVELADTRQRLVEVVGYDGDRRIRGEAVAGGFQHGRGEVDGNGFGFAAHRRIFLDQICFNQGEQASVTGAEVEDAASIFWDEFQEGGFAFGAVRDGVGAFEVISGVVW